MKPTNPAIEDTFCTQPINDDSSCKEQRRETERISIDDPLQLGHGQRVSRTSSPFF
jgi:hypothetical protein